MCKMKVFLVVFVLAVLISVAPATAASAAPLNSPRGCSNTDGLNLCYQIIGPPGSCSVTQFNFTVVGNYTDVSPTVISMEVTGPAGWHTNIQTVRLAYGQTTNRYFTEGHGLAAGAFCAQEWTDWGAFNGKCYSVEC